jgi:putative hydrolase of the HAD superfamily
MTAMAVEAVIFDWGGTLSIWADVDLLDLWQACAERLAPDRAAEVREQLVAVEQRAWDRVLTDQRSSRLADMLAEATAELGLDVTDAALELAATQYLDAWTPHVVHDPEAAPMLRQLRRRGLRTGLLSNTHWPRAFHEHFLERDGLGELLDVRCYSSELAHTKPHPEAFRAVLDALGVVPEAAVFVGDRPLDDIAGAQGVGMRAVLRPNAAVASNGASADAVISSLAELPDLLDEWA